MKPLPSWVTRRLQEVPGLVVRLGARNSLEIQRERSNLATFHVKLHGRLGARDVEWILSRPESRQELIATHILSGGVRDSLASARVSWVERDTGLVHLDTAPLFVHLEPSKPVAEPQTDERPLSFAGTSGIIAEALLDSYRERPFTLREMAEQIGAGKGRVSQVFSQLIKLGILQAEGKTRNRIYQVRDPSRILDEWAKSSPAPRESTPFYVWSRSPPEVYQRLSSLNVAGLSWAIGGQAAAHLYTSTLSVLPTPEVWVQGDVPARRIARVLDAEIVGPEESPSLTIWQTGGDPALVFRREREVRDLHGYRLWVVSQPRAYVEARAAGGRGVDAAEALREEMRL